MRPISLATLAPVHTWSSSQPWAAGLWSRNPAGFSRQRGESPHRRPPGPRVVNAAVPASFHFRRHWYAELRLTRSRRATSGGLTP